MVSEEELIHSDEEDPGSFIDKVAFKQRLGACVGVLWVRGPFIQLRTFQNVMELHLMV